MTEKKTSQKKNIKTHLEKVGFITPLEALQLYGCFRLASRIAELREEGLAIVTERPSVGKQYAIYRLLPFGEADE